MPMLLVIAVDARDRQITGHSRRAIVDALDTFRVKELANFFTPGSDEEENLDNNRTLRHILEAILSQRRRRLVKNKH